MPATKCYAIIVGGGSGSRMQSDIPKQFMLLDGKPVLMHTIEAFHSSGSNPQILVVLNADFHQYWTGLCTEHNFIIPHQLVAGGQQRFHSVKNALKHLESSTVVAIHDAVRPCVSADLINAAYRQAEELGTGVAAVKSRDSVRKMVHNGTVSLNREEIYLVQTPQVFQSGILIKAYEQDYRPEFTDDASVVERSGVPIRIIEGDTKNLKITYPEDLLIAGVYLKAEK